jgi:hypothetical protein
MSATHTLTYSRTHTSTYVADTMRNVLRDIVTAAGLDPTHLLDSWSSNLGRAMRRWLESGHLTGVTIEFYVPGSNQAAARWDFPVSYDGSGSHDDMWISKRHISRTLEKAEKPPANAAYRVVLTHSAGAPDVEGMCDTEFKSTAGLVSRPSGTAISTPDIMAGLTYWRAE